MKRLRTAILIAAVSMVTSMGFAQGIKMVKIPGKDIKMSATEITQKQYETVMGENPSLFQQSNEKIDEEYKSKFEKDTSNFPVEKVSFYDAIYFCNCLSVKEGKTPVYAVNGETDVKKWGYTPHKEIILEGEVTQNIQASGYRIPTMEEFVYAAKGGQNFKYSGSDNIDEVAWYEKTSNGVMHSVAQKKPNGYGLYDMSGNVREWVWDQDSFEDRLICSGSFEGYAVYCQVDFVNRLPSEYSYANIGFRIVCRAN